MADRCRSGGDHRQEPRPPGALTTGWGTTSATSCFPVVSWSPAARSCEQLHDTSIRTDAAQRGVGLHNAQRRAQLPARPAEIGWPVALGPAVRLVVNLVRQFARRMSRAGMAKFASGEWAGETIQSLTERTGGSDLASSRPLPDTGTATPGVSTFQMVRVERPTARRGWCSPSRKARRQRARYRDVLVLRERRDGARNGIRIVPQGRSSAPARSRPRKSSFRRCGGVPIVRSGRGRSRRRLRQGPCPHDGDDQRRRGRHRDDGPRCARRALVEAMCYARVRNAFASRWPSNPSCSASSPSSSSDVEAAQALVFDGFDPKHGCASVHRSSSCGRRAYRNRGGQ